MTEIPDGYRALDEASLADYLAGVPALAQRLGGGPGDWSIRETGDGNLNLVFIVAGPQETLVVKQALPYVRLVGEGWPLTPRRNQFEYQLLARQQQVAADLVPATYHHDPALCLTVMAYYGRHEILRSALVDGRSYHGLSEAMGRYLADMLFHSSDLGQDSAAKKRDVAVFAANTAMCQISEGVIFTDPYFAAPLNRWTSPQLDAIAHGLRSDTDLLVAAQELKAKFMGRTEALIHGDLHTGSIMIAEGDMRIIDGEFAFYGPMGFDVGAYLGNLLLAYFAQPGHEAEEGERAGFRTWLLQQVEDSWGIFEQRFRRLWAQRSDAVGAYPRAIFDQDGTGLADQRAKDRYMKALLADALGFGAIKMIRRLVGIAHVADFETIEDPDARAACERRALVFARELAVRRADVRSIADVTALARHVAG